MARLFDMHVHTTKGSADSSLSPEEMVLEAERLGFLGICLTEHSGPWDRHEFQRFAALHDLVLIRAMEVETDMGHILTFGLDRYLPGISDPRKLRSEVERVGGFMITAHPFRGLYHPRPATKPLLYQNAPSIPETVEEAARHPVFGLVDAVEVANGSTADTENRFAVSVAEYLKLKVTGGSDAHSQHGMGSYITVFENEINNEEEFINALRAHSFYPAKFTHKNRDLDPEPYTAQK